ncbi:pyridoxamine 5'-phosphate oxidase family protein [Amycolatopsis suaedae]|uniref:Pyridoxamine 5'-phosphate oxidase N-terminal domain-containing protein n=1 Tax=Amycolatopsis suaedae TaxID=2510978 RepID=A0A4Q7J8D5_9PSEU|nr:pyridoxamine 5'-phosphate oxidase family protein [Amycolatopsis suaedae]RZQ62354.1 hypothetical protein EWH70_18960 [Amycolatopsis suaedae]
MELICDVAELEHVVGSRMLPVMMKSIDRLDQHAVALLGRSPAAVLGYVDAGGAPRARVVGGAPGFAVPETSSRLRLPLPRDAAAGTGAALLVLLPGWRETLRVNGTVGDGGLTVEEVFLHCGKAVIRSDLWGEAAAVDNESTEDGPGIGPAATEFLAAAPFVVVTSRDGAGHADASPKGDPPGVVRPIGPSTVMLADRPGNRRTDTFHNILERPEVAIVAMVPGDDRTLELTGTATVSADRELRESMSERNRVPKAVLLVEVAHTRLTPSAALSEAALWDTGRHIDPGELPRPATIWTDHVKLNETTGVAAGIIRKAANERMIRTGVNLDYQQNLY